VVVDPCDALQVVLSEDRIKAIRAWVALVLCLRSLHKWRTWLRLALPCPIESGLYEEMPLQFASSLCLGSRSEARTLGRAYNIEGDIRGLMDLATHLGHFENTLSVRFSVVIGASKVKHVGIVRRQDGPPVGFAYESIELVCIAKGIS